METEKIKMSVKQALPMLAEMIKLKYVTDTLGKSSGWIYNKMNHDSTTTFSKGFKQSDIKLLNDTFHEIGGKLMNTRFFIPAGEDKTDLEIKQEVISQIQSISAIISMPYIYSVKMGKPRSWYMNRMLKNSTKATFKQQDINLFNLAIVEIGNKLLSIELTL